MPDLPKFPHTLTLNISAGSSLARDDPAAFDELRQPHIEEARAASRQARLANRSPNG